MLIPFRTHRMTFRLPQPILERVFLARLGEIEEPVYFPMTRGDKNAYDIALADLLAWSLVSRQWGEAYLATKYATTRFFFTRDEEQVGDVCSLMAVHLVISLRITDVEMHWLIDGLPFFAQRLLLLDLDFVDFSVDGIRNLRLCVNLERLGLACEEEHRGDLHEALTILRFLPSLEHLSLERFDASLPPSDNTPPSSPSLLTTLSLDDVGGSRCERLLLSTFTPDSVPKLSELVLRGLGKTLTYAFLHSFHHQIDRLAYQLDVSSVKDVVLLPRVPFPSLHHLSLELSPCFPLFERLLTYSILCMAFWSRQLLDGDRKIPRPLRLDSLNLVHPEYSEREAEAARTTLLNFGAVTSAEASLFTTAQTARDGLESLIVSHLNVVFSTEDERVGFDSSLTTGLEPFEPVEALEKGRDMRKKWSEEEAVHGLLGVE
jgi:hypothetical protein